MIFVPLSAPTAAGLDASTRIRYPLPAGNPLGIVAAMFNDPVELEDNVPIAVGAANEPALLDN